MQDQRADLEWRDGDVPVSTRFDDPYFSLENGLDETRHVFLAGNGLPARFRDGFHIGELGFGTGLNFMVTLAAWRAAGVDGVLHFTSFEAYPMSVEEMARALAAFGIGDELVAVWNGRGGRFEFDDAVLEVITGDARVMLPAWQGKADAWFLDGFSPAKNPELWDETLMQAVADHTAPQGTIATYTAAGFVRRGLDAAGFEVSRISGYGRKRHMTVGTKR
ncbi:tRNA (5-methylaminomethyl-2-thiouridine)(34)-methyltransferase MnmD [Sulfitobacter pseudonitzschiae]|uniref:tRNA (5-methylaminomethyl-2-thiouridine)(34)-methyltransferase MnmD n=1 Tax=Pseudosulfitobacter pseudonitzschiae TaxID=1402135 RepID=A0A9Q2RXG0_9RHOB|nr:tRNA (5-methylaminomethyl-2-thiouridine)(34)-methyltransferase MnmD [Pseudosulfitobacter pseudonitzschiae]MBM2292475.1 tRNA (5-methylaminomethyl-2-thiouridine)(34)-methyltransferase MnmD [Pseudosulfitobacter pseudonitzschiae]MBM2297392.1 tRNA (5-methylaminomethyl-2-thiouridine)(34)-methyltransferase MnmD [Pseudosulfitobacter pseudonitzschiae]MBM2302306.1 tRNA (5-methylaminomethyl-2-thiouridine)(34)-methyltransferase MnmD [Pseudosulfitobacter pseudonitzschiae]MBM2312089.1 tRNA (5-methylaminom